MAIVAKMVVVSAEQKTWNQHRGSEQPDQEDVKLDVVYSDDPDDPNRSWSEATPSGALELTITNKDAIGKLKVGQEYYVEIRKARS